MPYAAPLLAALAVAWFIVVCIAPWLPAPAAGLIYACASMICHQLPARSFHLDGVQLPVCARCTGIYLGGAAGAALCVRAQPRVLISGLLSRSPSLTSWLIIGAAPIAATLLAEWSGLWLPGNAARGMTGVPAGVVLMTVVTSALSGNPRPLENVQPRRARVLEMD